MAPCRTTTVPAGPRRGAASLIVVMVLFFVMALAGAYSSRNLIFEQRTSANQYRSTQAIETAEAGVEWALAMLNGGRIGTDCREAGAAANATSFRQRYLEVLDDGRLRPAADLLAPVPTAPAPPLPVPPPTPLMPSCVFNGADWMCSCPTQGPPIIAAPVGAGPFPAFRVRFSVYDGVMPNVNNPVITKPGLVMIEVNGCTRADDSCLEFPGSSSDQEGRATVRVMVALKSALPTPPAASLTVLDAVPERDPGVVLEVVNADPESGGLTIQAGGGINTAGMTLRTLPGSADEAVVRKDEWLDGDSPNSLKVAVPPLNANRVFASIFGTLPETYRLQPAALPFTCPPANCRQALSDLAALHPGRVIWIDGDLRLDSDGDIGGPATPPGPAIAGPVVIVATGNLVATANARIFGYVYSQSGDWTGAPEVQGAAFVEDGLAASAGGRIVFNRDVIQHLQHRSGSFVRVPGGWRDFQ